MSETRYTPEQMRERARQQEIFARWAISHWYEGAPISIGEAESLLESAAMLRQAATDAEQVEYQRRLIVSMEELLRSAHCIAARRGEGTHWDRFAASVQALGIGPVTARTYRVLPSDTEDNLPMADTEPNGVDVWLIKWAISNCHTLARRRIKAGSTDSDWWGHVLRLCEKAGAKSLGVLRVGECDALGQAATYAEALAALRLRVDGIECNLRRAVVTDTLENMVAQVVSDRNALKHERDVLQRISARRAGALERVGLHADCTLEEASAQRQKVREFYRRLRRMLDKTLHSLNEQHNDADDMRAKALDDVVELANALALTGDATEGKG